MAARPGHGPAAARGGHRSHRPRQPLTRHHVSPARWRRRARSSSQNRPKDATRALAGHALHAPTLLPFEFANVARSKSRAGAPAERVLLALQNFDDLRIELHPVLAADLHALALVHGLTAYDAAYLSLAKRMNAPLLTFDLKLADAAARALGSPD